jgi:hypothetical protein
MSQPAIDPRTQTEISSAVYAQVAAPAAQPAFQAQSPTPSGLVSGNAFWVWWAAH